MNGVSLVFHYRLLFYVGVNSNGGIERRGEERRTEEKGGEERREEGSREKTEPSATSAVLYVSEHTRHDVCSPFNTDTQRIQTSALCLSETKSSVILNYWKVQYLIHSAHKYSSDECICSTISHLVFLTSPRFLSLDFKKTNHWVYCTSKWP